jgi:hypothetical protein
MKTCSLSEVKCRYSHLPCEMCEGCRGKYIRGSLCFSCRRSLNDPAREPSAEEVAWAAGIYEGEGSCSLLTHGGGAEAFGEAA